MPTLPAIDVDSPASPAGQGLASSPCSGISLPRPYHEESAVTIYHGDSRHILPLMGRFDLLLTDPPYGINQDRGMGGGGWDSTGKYRRKPRKYEGGWDEAAPTLGTMCLLLDAAERSIIWGANYFSDRLPRGGRWLVWDKEQVMPTYSDAELAWTNLENLSVKLYSLHCNKARIEQGLHPTQKPLALMQWCIQQAGDIQSILDPYAGSGTTGVAAKNLGKRAVLIEREERYCEIAARRLAQDVLPLDCPNVGDQ